MFVITKIQTSFCAKRQSCKLNVGGPWVLGSSGSAALKTDLILWWELLHGLRNTSENHHHHRTQFISASQIKHEKVLQASFVQHFTPSLKLFLSCTQ